MRKKVLLQDLNRSLASYKDNSSECFLFAVYLAVCTEKLTESNKFLYENIIWSVANVIIEI